MNGLEKNAVRLVAKLAPWLAPVPSAFFVARSGMKHLDLPLTVAVIVAAIIETLGLATVHTALWAHDWNLNKRKIDPGAPVGLSIALGGVYILATWSLVVLLEVWPWLATYAPAVFPVLAVVGAVNLAMISRQERREVEVAEAKAEARRKRQEKKEEVSARKNESSGNGHRKYGSWQEFMADYPNMLEMSGEEIGKLAGVSGRTGRNWKRAAGL